MDTLTQDTFLVIEPDTAAFKPGDRYEWMVTTAGDTATTSDALFFEIGEAATEQRALQSAQKAPLYQQSTEEVRILLHAVALEQGDWYEEAQTVPDPSAIRIKKQPDPADARGLLDAARIKSPLQKKHFLENNRRLVMGIGRLYVVRLFF
ncbi:MAG: hypothetical protein IPH16_14110 [Haliscomenobacter sp.]|nr:hypothetical protein [Haliscomenobacter sp.]